MKKVALYYIFYELVVGDVKTRYRYSARFDGVFKKAENAKEMDILHDTAHTHLLKHHGGEGRTVNITGMEYLSLQQVPKEEKSKSKNDGGKANSTRTTKKNTRTRG